MKVPNRKKNQRLAIAGNLCKQCGAGPQSKHRVWANNRAFALFTCKPRG